MLFTPLVQLYSRRATAKTLWIEAGRPGTRPTACPRAAPPRTAPAPCPACAGAQRLCSGHAGLSTDCSILGRPAVIISISAFIVCLLSFSSATGSFPCSFPCLCTWPGTRVVFLFGPFDARSPMPLRCREEGAGAVRTPVPVRCRAAALGRAENRSRATSPAGTPLRSRERAAGPTRKHACEPGAGALDGPIPLRGRRPRTPGRAGGPALLFGGAAPGAD